ADHTEDLATIVQGNVRSLAPRTPTQLPPPPGWRGGGAAQAPSATDYYATTPKLARETSSMNNLHNIGAAVQLYHDNYDRYPALLGPRTRAAGGPAQPKAPHASIAYSDGQVKVVKIAPKLQPLLARRTGPRGAIPDLPEVENGRVAVQVW